LKRWRWPASIVESRARSLTGALVLLLLALLAAPIPLPRSAYDYVFVFDITQSMNVEDYDIDGVPFSRLDYARKAARTALRQLPCGSRVGWGAFAEYRTLLLLAPIEVCSNYNDLLASLDQIDGRMRWGNASEITKGLFWAMRAAKEAGPETQVVFLTDGHEAPPLNSAGIPLFDDLKRGELRGWLIGVGGPVPRTIPKIDRDGKAAGFWLAEDVDQGSSNAEKAGAAGSHEHLSNLHEAHLQSLAEQVGFEYATLSNLASLGNVILDSRFAQRRPTPTDLSWLPACVALFLLVVHFRPDRRPARRS
jgi:mxaL protein